MRRFIWIIGLFTVVAGAVWYGFGHSSSKASTEQSWRTATIERGSIIAAVNATGTINPTATAIVGSQVSGQVLEILADYNSNVKAGDILARLNAEQTRARLDGAKADFAQSNALNLIQKAQIEKVRADIERSSATKADALANGRKADAVLADAEKTLARQTELKNRGIASEVTLQQAQTLALTQRAAKDQALAQVRSVDAQIQSLAAELKVAETQVLSSQAQIAQKEAMVRQIEVDIRNSDIRSPVEGVVIQRNIELGQSVAASLQAPTLFLVAQDLTKIEIYANVDEADVGRVLSGQQVTFSVTAFPAREFQGRVKTVRLGSQSVQNVVIYTAVIEVANTDLALKPGKISCVCPMLPCVGALQASSHPRRLRPPPLPCPTRFQQHLLQVDRTRAGKVNSAKCSTGWQATSNWTTGRKSSWKRSHVKFAKPRKAPQILPKAGVSAAELSQVALPRNSSPF
jgi:HlyD family secretion protein